MRNPFTDPVALLAHVCAIVIVLIFGIAMGLAAPHFPKLEGLLRPIVSAAKADQPTSRDKAKACFSLRLHKLHAAAPVVYQFAIEVRQNEHWLAPINVNAHLANSDDSPAADDYIEHKVGSTWNRRWCFDMPSSVSAWQVIRVSGFAVHRAHPLWETHSPTPSLIIPGV